MRSVLQAAGILVIALAAADIGGLSDAHHLARLSNAMVPVVVMAVFLALFMVVRAIIGACGLVLARRRRRGDGPGW